MKKLFSTIVSLVVILAIGFAAYEAYLKKPSAAALAEPIVIGNGMSASEIAAVLKKAGIISSTAVFTAVVGLSGSFEDLHAGTFLFKQGMSAVDALKTLSVKGQAEVNVTVPEGFELKQIAERLVASGVIKAADELYSVAGTPGQKTAIAAGLTEDYAFLADKPANASLEGYLFPDTYRFYAGASAETVVRKMLDTYKSKIEGLRNKPSFNQLIVASLVESEVKTEADRAKVADIIERRLKVGMPLQLDSTVNYATGKSLPSVTLGDLDVDSPYNTYKYKGLPLGPITNPGLSSLRAALAPTPNPYWYFLTATDGTVIYSMTLQEHNAAKVKYLK